MRETLYKAISKEGNDWVEGTYHYSDNGNHHYILEREVFIDTNKGRGKALLDREVTEVIRETVCQYITTVNGIRLFEGDIIHESGAYLVWDKDLMCYCFKHPGDDTSIPLLYDQGGFDKIEKTFGNIHDHGRKL